MAVQHYSGPLGVFDYDDTQFKLKPPSGLREHENLQYIGKETHGTGISIPQGIKDISGMFKSADLVSAPEIPDGVVKMDDTFAGCKRLKVAPKLPDSVKLLNGTFKKCSSLERAPIIPEGVTEIAYMFNDCKTLDTAPSIPNSVRHMNSAFEGCELLLEAPEIPDGVSNMSCVFSGCRSLTKPPVIPDSVTYLGFAFKGCELLQEAPKIPDGVKNIVGAFHDCKELLESPVIPDGVTMMNEAFSGCKSLRTAPVIPDSVISADAAFMGCTSLKVPPVLPANVKSCTDVFYGCHFDNAPSVSAPSNLGSLKSPYANPLLGPDSVVMGGSSTDNVPVKDAGAFIVMFPDGEDVRKRLIDSISSITDYAQELLGLEEGDKSQKIFISKESVDAGNTSSVVVIYDGIPDGADAVKAAVKDAIPNATIDKDTYAVLETQMRNVKDRYSVDGGSWIHSAKKNKIESSFATQLNESLLQENMQQNQNQLGD